ncbi:MAG TPA: class I SAM-dependent methyltransferase [Candidatus Baltobacteraceae bacterium]|nr:class I SAM-dependent methyltransferase [Candidatus Baltobacteraceae bacterium]
MDDAAVVHPLLLELEQFARKEDIPTIPRATGRFLWVLIHGMQANRILEIGTAFGYATMWMALAQPPLGKIWTFDPDIDRTEVARSYFQRAGEDDHIEIVNQPALEVLPIFPQRNMDIVFVDSPEKDYREYLDYCIPLLKLSGLLIFTNLYDERCADFNESFLNHPELAATILPIGGGLGIGARRQ